LNGCRYPENGPPRQLNFEELLKIIRRELLGWCGGLQQVPSAHFLAVVRLLGAGGGRERPQTLLTAVARSGEQKMRLLRQGDGSGKSALDRILEGIGSRGLCIILGSGDGEYDQFLIRRAAKHDNLIFLNGYSPACAQALYAAGDLFLMPSSFEPCGLSQMLAMAAGQPCLVHAVGGLKDTVRHGRNGFVFGGDTVAEQARNFVTATLEAIALQQNNPGTWHEISKKAAAARFTWQRTAEGYLDQLYNPLS
ncbi:MAG: glycosyltransferase, partial [Desulfobacterales bacterium]